MGGRARGGAERMRVPVRVAGTVRRAGGRTDGRTDRRAGGWTGERTDGSAGELANGPKSQPADERAGERVKERAGGSENCSGPTANSGHPRIAWPPPLK